MTDKPEESHTGPATPIGTKRVYSAMDHYNAAAASLQEISDHYEDEDFGVGEASLLLQVANTHAALGTLKLNIDRIRWEGKQ